MAIDFGDNWKIKSDDKPGAVNVKQYTDDPDLVANVCFMNPHTIDSLLSLAFNDKCERTPTQ